MEAAYNFLTGPNLILCFIAFMLASYILLGLLTWSFVRPLKYIGVTSIITGIITLSLKGGVYLTVNYFARDELELFKPFLDECGNLFAIIGTIFIASGIILIVIHKIIDYFYQKNMKEKTKTTETKKAETKTQEERTEKNENVIEKKTNKVKKEENL